MTPDGPLASAVAACLLDGEWEAARMVERLASALGGERRWMRTIARHAYAEFPLAPRDAPEALARWVRSRKAFRRTSRDRPLVRRWATPAPCMAFGTWAVPAIPTVGDLAAWLDVDLVALAVLADLKGLLRRPGTEARRHYHHRWVAKRSGGQRLLEAPKLRLKTLQRRVLDGIVAHIPPDDAAHGFRTGRSVAGFARPHTGQAVVMRTDLASFFPSVSAGRVFGIFRTAGYPEEVARTLAALCTHRTPADVLARGPALDAFARARLLDAHLPQGAPSSGALANLAAYRLDRRIGGLARAAGAHYTRYADDLVLSGGRELAAAAPALLARIGAIALEEGFAVNPRKTRVMTAADRQRVTGVVVNRKLSLARDELERLRAILHNCARTGPDAQNRDGRPDFRAHLRGRIAWVAQLDPRRAEPLREAFARIRWEAT